jgi:hypothetical protein
METERNLKIVRGIVLEIRNMRGIRKLWQQMHGAAGESVHGQSSTAPRSCLLLHSREVKCTEVRFTCGLIMAFVAGASDA